MLENIFKLKENGTSIKTELLAGLATFLTMAYIIVVNPAILSTEGTGMDFGGVFVATIIAAVVASGLAINNFYFAGFPVKKKQARINSLTELAEINTTIIWFESPKRILSFLNELVVVFGNRQAVVARELTKKYEEHMGSI